MPDPIDLSVYQGFESDDPARPAMNACYNCKHARPVRGSSHHQSCASVYATPEAAIVVLMLAAAGKLESSGFVGVEDDKRMPFRASQHGADRGWFVWPFDFDPVWLIECGFFEPKTDGEDQ